MASWIQQREHPATTTSPNSHGFQQRPRFFCTATSTGPPVADSTDFVFVALIRRGPSMPISFGAPAKGPKVGFANKRLDTQVLGRFCCWDFHVRKMCCFSVGCWSVSAGPHQKKQRSFQTLELWSEEDGSFEMIRNLCIWKLLLRFRSTSQTS